MDSKRSRHLFGTKQFRWLLVFATYPGYFFGEWVGRELTLGEPLVTALLLASPVAAVCGLTGRNLLASLLLAVVTGWGGAEGAWNAWIPGPPAPIFVAALAAALLSYALAVFVRRSVQSHRDQD